jgi:hypothetical protein
LFPDDESKRTVDRIASAGGSSNRRHVGTESCAATQSRTSATIGSVFASQPTARMTWPVVRGRKATKRAMSCGSPNTDAVSACRCRRRVKGGPRGGALARDSSAALRKGLSQREIHRRTGLHRDTIRKAVIGSEPPV